MENERFINDILPLQQKMFRFALSFTRDRQQAEDIVQETFEKLWMKRSEMDRYNNAENFVMRSVRNLCIDKIKPRKIHDRRLEEYKYGRGKAEAANERFDTERMVRDALGKLPEKQQSIIHLRDMEGYEMDRIAQIMEIKESVARVILSRARKALKDELIKVMNYGI